MGRERSNQEIRRGEREIRYRETERDQVGRSDRGRDQTWNSDGEIKHERDQTGQEIRQ